MNSTHVMKHFFFKPRLLKFFWRKLLLLRTRFYLRFNPKLIANRDYKTVFKKNINWNKPVDLIEKIQWLQIYSDTSLWTVCSDKFLVRNFVEEKGCGDVLNKLYGKWTNTNDIDWGILPNSFVLKSNNSCGDVLLVKDKNKLDVNKTRTRLNIWMKNIYGYHNAQLHYTRIEPCIIAEKLFINKKEPNKSLIDYKIWCFHGEPECIFVPYNRTDTDYSISLYDIEWNNISDYGCNKENMHFDGRDIARPSSLVKMLEVAKKLSKNFPQVRVDFYDIDGEAVFGEMTFTTGFGYFSEEYYKYLGSKIDLSKVKKLPKPNTISLFS